MYNPMFGSQPADVIPAATPNELLQREENRGLVVNEQHALHRGTSRAGEWEA
jgi:hypothetical protein